MELLKDYMVSSKENNKGSWCLMQDR
jgi:hypothetical protein